MSECRGGRAGAAGPLPGGREPRAAARRAHRDLLESLCGVGRRMPNGCARAASC